MAVLEADPELAVDSELEADSELEEAAVVVAELLATVAVAPLAVVVTF